MSSFSFNNKTKINPNKENASHSVKSTLDNNNSKKLSSRSLSQNFSNENSESSLFPSFTSKKTKTLTRASSSTLSLTRKSSSNALRAKSTNSLSLRNQSDQLQQLSDRQLSLGAGFNKVRKTTTVASTSSKLSDIFERSSSSINSSENKNYGAKKLHVDRDSPLSSLSRKQHLSSKKLHLTSTTSNKDISNPILPTTPTSNTNNANSSNKDLFEQLRREMELEERSEPRQLSLFSDDTKNSLTLQDNS
ncbi:unnamed protein product [Ambrosiozyma monospora]|uniref:Unnamed protein product n=1 Tax=Ambrosiozyma monospora TaxID=43982 RepID=A0ACB5U448_AMBMO|nr:unnamed protein product [Ambrosiozyma monospora]